MTDTPIDMHLPETFHRLKRTVLLFSAGLIVLGVATPSATTELHLTLINMTLASSVARWLLWLGGLYYLCGFGLEVSAARRLNAEPIRGEGLRAFERHLRTMATKSETDMAALSPAISDQAQALQNWLGKLDAAFATWAETLSEQKRTYLAEEIWLASRSKGDTDPQLSTAALQNLQGMINSTGDGFLINMSHMANDISVLRAELPGLQAQGDSIGTAQQQLLDVFKSHADRMRRLHPLITGERVASFYFWEVGGAAGAFLVASLIGWPPGRAISDAVAHVFWRVVS